MAKLRDRAKVRKPKAKSPAKKLTKARAPKRKATSYDDTFAFCEPGINKDKAEAMAVRTKELEREGDRFAYKPLRF